MPLRTAAIGIVAIIFSTGQLALGAPPAAMPTSSPSAMATPPAMPAPAATPPPTALKPAPVPVNAAKPDPAPVTKPDPAKPAAQKPADGTTTPSVRGGFGATGIAKSKASQTPWTPKVNGTQTPVSNVGSSKEAYAKLNPANQQVRAVNPYYKAHISESRPSIGGQIMRSAFDCYLNMFHPCFWILRIARSGTAGAKPVIVDGKEIHPPKDLPPREAIPDIAWHDELEKQFGCKTEDVVKAIVESKDDDPRGLYIKFLEIPACEADKIEIYTNARRVAILQAFQQFKQYTQSIAWEEEDVAKDDQVEPDSPPPSAVGGSVPQKVEPGREGEAPPPPTAVPGTKSGG